MKIVNPSVEMMRCGLEKEFITPEQFIEKVGRTCYKSEDKITEDSAAKFVGNLISRGHEAMIEHWSLIFQTDSDTYAQIKYDCDALQSNCNLPVKERLRPFLRFTDQRVDSDNVRYILSGNMRALRDYLKLYVEWFNDIPQYFHDMICCYPLFFPEYQNRLPQEINHDILIPITPIELVGDKERSVHMNVTMKFICDRGVSHEMVRHRVASFAQESTRYCNYGGDKFGNEITVIRPSWCKPDSDAYSAWREGCLTAEGSYFALLSVGCAPQEARSVLPNSTKTEIIVTMNVGDWDHFFALRCAPSAHPDMREVACMARDRMDGVLYGV